MTNRELETRYNQLKATWKNLVNANVELVDENKILKEEIERLNNIINELEKELEERYLDFKDSECEEVRTTAYEDISILKRIKELKGSDKK